MKSEISQRERRFALWRCKRCGEFHVRASRRIVVEDSQWTFTDDVQSPCPKCGYRQRLKPKDCRLYRNKDDANDGLDWANRTSGGWL